METKSFQRKREHVIKIVSANFFFDIISGNQQSIVHGKEEIVFQGLRTVIYRVDNIEKAKKWYADILGIQPYFDEPFYVGFNVGGFELGLDPDTSGMSKGNTLVAYWGVTNIEQSLNHLLAKGAKKNTDIQDVGGDIRVATVLDPFGNVFGIIENPHFKITE